MLGHPSSGLARRIWMKLGGFDPKCHVRAKKMPACGTEGYRLRNLRSYSSTGHSLGARAMRNLKLAHSKLCTELTTHGRIPDEELGARAGRG